MLANRVVWIKISVTLVVSELAMGKEFRRQKEDWDEDDETTSGKHRKGSAQDKQDDVNRRKRESKRLSRERDNKANDSE
jgi:hypothetical protein